MVGYEDICIEERCRTLLNYDGFKYEPKFKLIQKVKPIDRAPNFKVTNILFGCIDLTLPYLFLARNISNINYNSKYIMYICYLH